jgi:hypothetical protein
MGDLAVGHLVGNPQSFSQWICGQTVPAPLKGRRILVSSSAMAYSPLGPEWSVPFRLTKLEQGNGTGRTEVAEHRCR